MKKMRILIILAVLLAGSVNATIVVVNTQNYIYSPNAVTISCGDTIRFHWVNGTHPTVSETGKWVTFTLSAGMPDKDIVFAVAGSYPYYCDFHGGPGGTGMAGSITVTCAPPTCSTPTGVMASLITSSSAKISWNPAAGATKYQIQYRKSGTAAWSKSNTTMTSKNLIGLIPATSYQYKVKTICATGSSAFSAIQTFTTLAFEGAGGGTKEPVQEEVHVTQIGVYPNPNNGDFQLVMEHVHQSDVLVQVYDLTGRLILEKTFPVNDMSVIENITMPAGFTGNAILKVNANGKDYTKDISVQ